MQEELIKFQTAKLAKERGFNENCDWIYFLPHPELAKQEGEQENVWIPIPNSSSLINGIKKPTQTLLSKWLREVHKIDVIVHRSFSMEYSYHYCIIKECDYENEIQQEVTPNRKYEEALEFGLLEGLKLIK